MQKLKMDKAVIVSPSMSGVYSVPLLRDHPRVFKGYVPVAPDNTNMIPDSEYESLQVGNETDWPLR